MSSSTNTNTLPREPITHSIYIGGLDKSDMIRIDALKKILDKKLSLGDNTLDIKKLAYYCNRTEMQARQYIAYLEAEVYYQRKFIITNGAKEFEKIDQIRFTAIQERAASENK